MRGHKKPNEWQIMLVTVVTGVMEKTISGDRAAFQELICVFASHTFVIVETDMDSCPKTDLHFCISQRFIIVETEKHD